MLKNLAQVTSVAAERFGSKPALVFEGRWFSFAEIDALACRLANALKGLGIKPGDRVTLYSGNCWEWIVSYYGILETGAVANPLNVMLTAPEVAYVTRDCGARAIIASADKGAPLLDIKKDTPLEHVILFGPEVPSGAKAFEDMTGKGKDTFKPPNIETDALSTICYTSGTTGHPKGAMLSHRNVLMNTALTAVMHRRTEHDTIVTALPCAHVYGNVVMNGCFFYGGTLALIRRFEELAVLEAIQEHRATMVGGEPPAIKMLQALHDFSIDVI